MFSHITVGVTDLERAAQFYDAILAPLGLVQRPVARDDGPAALCWCAPNQALPWFYTYLPFDGQEASPGNGSMVAFLAPSPDAVTAAHTAGLANGGRDEGGPGARPAYGAGYFGAYLRDPDSNKIHIVCRPPPGRDD